MVSNLEEISSLFTNKAIYLSGPMTGIPDNNKGAFEAAESFIKGLGTPLKGLFNPCSLEGDLERHEAMRYDLGVLLAGEFATDVIVVLPGWYTSKGALLEIAIAKECKIPRIYFADPYELHATLVSSELSLIHSATRPDGGLFLYGG